MDQEPSIKEKVGGNIIQRKPKTELRKPKKSKKVEDVDPIILRKRMRQLYKAVVNYQVIFKKANYALVCSPVFLGSSLTTWGICTSNIHSSGFHIDFQLLVKFNVYSMWIKLSFWLPCLESSFCLQVLIILSQIHNVHQSTFSYI